MQSVNHTNQFTSVTFGFDTKPGVALGDVTDYINKTAAEVLPPTVKGELQGEGLVLQQLFNALPFLVIAAVFVMYVILGILYESYVHPVTVLSTLFPAVVGGLMTLWLFHSTLSLYSVIGLFLLMGIVKKNGIMIVDFALHRLDEGYDRRAAIHEASVERFRPIIMTTLAALMGALPIALGFGADGSSRRPLGLVIVGGLIVSQLITLYITPGDLSGAGMVPGKRARPRAVPAQRAYTSRSRRGKACCRTGPGTGGRTLVSERPCAPLRVADRRAKSVFGRPNDPQLTQLFSTPADRKPAPPARDAPPSCPRSCCD